MNASPLCPRGIARNRLAPIDSRITARHATNADVICPAEAVSCHDVIRKHPECTVCGNESRNVLRLVHLVDLLFHGYGRASAGVRCSNGEHRPVLACDYRIEMAIVL